MNTLASLHQQLILDHYRNPRNKVSLEECDSEGWATNPMCGDEVTLQLSLDKDTIKGISFGGKGCSISQAAASMLSVRLRGSSLETASLLTSQFTGMMNSSIGEPDAVFMGDLLAFEGVRKFPLKVRCALLICEAFQKALEKANELGRREALMEDL
ncbi:MAG: SUF system NifU family Fe-S cluster assembly protein [Longimicrobiales bacterium]|nr:SUF system NifU family Fe-S cluster assembly protein [Longimicrobiales bacterium]